MFTDLSNPSTITALLIETALFVLAITVALVPRLLRPVRWLARSLAIVSLLVGIGGIASAVWEAWTFRYPVVLPDTAAGTYAHPTMVMMLGVAVTSLLVVVGAILAFRRPGLGGLLFVVYGLQTFLSATRSRLWDPTFPPGNLTMAIVAVALPTLAVGALLLGVSWAEHTAAQRRAGRRTVTGGALGVAS